jgi:hypothetical protein
MFVLDLFNTKYEKELREGAVDKVVSEGGPYDLPGKDYDRPGDTPRRQDHRAILAQDVIQMILTLWIQINVDYVLTRHVLKSQDEYHAKKKVWRKATAEI